MKIQWERLRRVLQRAAGIAANAAASALGAIADRARRCARAPFRCLARLAWGALLLAVAASVAVNVLVWAVGRAHVTAFRNAPRAQAAIVLGAGVGSVMLHDRVRRGAELYHAGRVGKLLMTGDHGRMSYDEVNAMRREAQRLGVPARDIFMDHAGFSTYESMYRARDIFKVRSAVVVTQAFHLTRAVYLARRLGIDATGVSADRRVYSNREHHLVREFLARIKAFLQVEILHSRPAFLGPPIPIDGDGRATWG